MSENAAVTFTLDNFPPDFCWQSPQQYGTALISLLHGFLPGNFSTFNYGNTTPTPENQDKPWIRTNGDGTLDGLYVFVGGYWARPYPVPPSSAVRWEWEGSEASLKTFDGGADVAVTDYTGPFWEVDHNYDGRSSMGVGTIPGRTIMPTSLALGDTTGEAQHVQTLLELFKHKHSFDIRDASGSGTLGVETAENNTVRESFDTNEQGNSDPFNVIHPVRANFKIKRTARIYVTV